MRKLFYTIAAVVACASVAAAGGPKTDPGLNAYQRFQGGPHVSPIPAPPAPEKTRKQASDIKQKATETSAALRAQEEADLLRRLAVCDRIKQIALEKGDNKMEDEAIRLEQRAEEVYKQRVASKRPSQTKTEEGRK
ncbi:MAG: hypothetical protein K1X57_13375 [Gemmataceae bacterium]|nr:hypothetical protein [Gemmataceae bacterium]